MRKGINRIYGKLPIFRDEKEALMYMYKITSEGRVFRKCDGKELCTVNGPKGYQYIRLRNPQFSKNNDGRKNYKVHRLVAMLYLPNYSALLQVNHKNGDKKDNRVENLEMVTNRENVIHAWRNLDVRGERRKHAQEMAPHIFGDTRVAVCQVKNGKVIATYPSMTAAALAINGKKGNIWSCIKIPNRTCKGYQWRLA